MSKYSPYDDYCTDAQKAQTVKTENDVLTAHPDYNDTQIADERCRNFYSCSDDYQMGTICDTGIYISTTDAQHDQIVNGECPTGLSGYFSDQATVDACTENGVVDNTQYNEMTQIQPYRSGGMAGCGDATYKPHLDHFEIDHERMQEVYGTSDFNAAIAKCDANNQFGSGGGNQGYNPHITEMLENGCLVHYPDRSFSDPSISNSTNLNSGTLNNSIVSEVDYQRIMGDASIKQQDCIENNTPNPSPETRDIGFEHNQNPIESNTGHATLISAGKSAEDTSHASQPSDDKVDMSCLYTRGPPEEGSSQNWNNTDMSCLCANSGNTTAEDISSGVRNAGLNHYGGMQ